jgi:glycosyltransferase involved in cell wall biosynthesis
MKKILMISYFYPPLNDVGGLRALAFSRYLPEHGWEPYVLSVKNPDKHACILGNEPAPSGVKTYYTRSIIHLSWITGKANGLLARILKLFNIRLTRPLIRDLICVPDEYIGWIPLTVLKGLSLMRKQGIDVIYVSCKPFSSAIIGVLLKRITKKPLILDFRDPVSPDPAFARDAYYRKIPFFRITKWIEEKVLRQADKLILTTEETRELYNSFFPFIKDRTTVVYNGFFEEYFSNKYEEFKKFTIVYSGNYYEQELSPDPFFKAISQAIKEAPALKDNIKFLYIGSHQEWLQTMIDRYTLQDVVHITGHVSREQSIEYISKSSILLLRIVPGMISTKLFEGLAAGAPFLALIEEGEVAAIIRRYSLSAYYIVKPNDVAAIRKAIIDSYQKWTKKLIIKAKNKRYFEDFNKKTLTAKFASIMNSLSADTISSKGTAACQKTIKAEDPNVSAE